jgi:hypothetical protein
MIEMLLVDERWSYFERRLSKPSGAPSIPMSAINPHNKVFPRLTFIDAPYKQRRLVNVSAELAFQFRCSGSRTLHDLVVPFFLSALAPQYL